MAVCQASVSSANILDITKFGHEQYQDIIVNNKVYKKASAGHNNCELRYSVIRKVLKEFKRPFTLCDLGASQGYYSLKGAYSYPDSIFVMVEGNNIHYRKIGSQLQTICEANSSLDNIILLQRQLILSDLQRLSECEDFDVVLAMNIFHWFGKQWKSYMDAVFNLGQYVIIETPQYTLVSNQEQRTIRKGIEKYIHSKGGKLLARVPRHTSKGATSPVYLVKTNKTKLLREAWFSKKDSSRQRRIESTHSSKKIIKSSALHSNISDSTWLPGINLCTFKAYNGTYPSSEVLLQSLDRLVKEDSFCMPTNILVQGRVLTPIKFANKNVHQEKIKNLLSGFIRSGSPNKVLLNFMKFLNDPNNEHNK